MLLILI